MREPTMRARCDRAVVAAGVLLAAAMPYARAEVLRTGSEPWYRGVPAEARQHAQALFEQARDKHLELLRGEAMELYEQAVALWDNPDIHWNLALVLDDLGRYLPAHEQLEAALRWGAALGADRLREVRDRRDALEAQRLGLIEASSDQPAADVQLDGQPWFHGPGHRSARVTPGMHYVAGSKPGYTPTAVSVPVSAGQHYRVRVEMVVDHLIETRHWSAWKPWAVVGAGATFAAVGAGFEWRAIRNHNYAAAELARACDDAKSCAPTAKSENERARLDSQRAAGAFIAGGVTLTVGLQLVWVNQPRWLHPEATHSPLELVPTVSPDHAGVAALLRF